MNKPFSSLQHESYSYSDINDAVTQSRQIASHERMVDLLDSNPDQVVLLNPNREIVFINQTTAMFAGIDRQQAVGLCPGDLYHCANCAEGKGKCGSTKYCSFCGMNEAFSASRRNNKAMRDYTITTPALQTCQFRVWTVPKLIDNTLFTIVYVRDISELVDKSMLEQLLLRRVRNLTDDIQQMLNASQKDPMHTEGVIEGLKNMTAELRDIVEEQDELQAAEAETLKPEWGRVNSLETLRTICKQMQAVSDKENKHLVIDRDSDRVDFVTAPALLSRILRNIIENALEATVTEEQVTVNCRQKGQQIEFSVFNNASIPDEIQLQLFKRHFSTREESSGMGAYCARLLAEKYLGGKISCFSSPAHGTTFILTLPLRKSV